MLKWVAPLINNTCSTVGDWMMFAGLLMFLLGVFLFAYRGTEALIEKGVRNEDQD